jgi:hypothetical protein
MKLNVSQEAAALERLTMRELRGKFAEVFGEATLAGNRTWLARRILWRLQALAEGDLSERGRRRAAQLANDADLRVIAPPLPRPPQSVPAPAPAPRPSRPAPVQRPAKGLPLAGTVITRTYKGARLEVRVLADGFEFQGTPYTSLSAVAKAITGQHCGGYYFFRLGKEEGR